MAFLAPIAAAVGGILGIGATAASLLKKSPKPQVIQPQGVATRDDALDQTARADELRRRRGSAADLITGVRGAEAAAGSVGKLVLGS